MHYYNLFIGLLLWSPLIVHADEPTVSYIFPAGGQRGTTVSFRVGGHYLHQQAQFEMLGDGVHAVERLSRSSDTIWFEGPVIPLPDSQRKEDYPVDHLGSVKIDENASLGLRRWRVMTSQGATATLPFVIGEHPESIEQEIDGRPIPTPVQLPVTINGRTFPREDIDIWTFQAKAGETYVCEVLARRMGSPLDASLKLVDSTGNVLAVCDDELGVDPRLVFTAPAEGEYALHLWDANLGGLQDYVYRLTLTSGPPVTAVWPLGGRRGEVLQFENLGPQPPAPPGKLDIPAEANPRIPIPGITGIWLETSDLPELREQEPNDTPDTATAGQQDAVWNGRIQSPGDVDVWRLSVTQGNAVSLDLRAAQLGSPLDSVLTIQDANGTILAKSDDRTANQPDAALTFQPKTDGTLYVLVADRFARRGGADFGYRLHVRAASALTPTYQLKLPTDALTVLRGGEFKLKITADRRHGFNGPISLAIDGLPAGVTFAPDVIPANKNDATLLFKASADADLGALRVKIRGLGEHAGQPIPQVATTTPLSPDDTVPDHLLLAVAVPTPFKVIGEFETKYAARGSTYVRRFRIDRGGFSGPLTISLAERQARHLQGVTGPVVQVLAGVDEFEYPIHLPSWMEIGRTSRTCVMAVGELTLADGSRHTVSATSHAQNDQIIVLVDPGQLSLRLDRASILAQPGETIEVPFTVERGTTLTGPVEVELILPKHIQGIHCPPTTIPTNQSRGTLQLTLTTSNPGLLNHPLVLRATATHNGQPYTAETPLRIYLHQ